MFTQSKPKLKWSADPQNTQWSENKSNFGYKMLEKMGWEKGKTLGQNKNGLLEPVKIVSNTNKIGIGCKTSYDDTWIAHQDDFASILSQLNDCSSENSSTSCVIGMEKTSKTQKRIHYRKFARGKDLSSYKNSDMIGIFGTSSKRSHSRPSSPTNLSDVVFENASISTDVSNDKKIKKDDQDHIANVEHENSSLNFMNFKVSKYDINEYFKQRSKTANCHDVNFNVKNESETKLDTNPLENSSIITIYDKSESKPVEKKKKKKSKKVKKLRKQKHTKNESKN